MNQHISHKKSYLDSQGSVLQPLPDWADLATLDQLYQWVLKTRLLDQKAVALQRTGQLGTYPSSLGQEAIYVAIGYTMAVEDILCPYYRDQGALLQRGYQALDLLRYWGGLEAGGRSHFKPYQDMPICVPIASQCLHAAGIGYAISLAQKTQAVVVTLGDGATSEGDFYEAMNFCALHGLPVVFVINNNQWAISTPVDQQTLQTELVHKATLGPMPGIQVDGNDIVAMVEVMQEALVHCYQGHGPILIEACTYRLCDHTTADDARRYQKHDDLIAAQSNDPIKRLHGYLSAQYPHWDPQSMEDALKTDLAEQVEQYQQTPTPDPESLFEHMYATLPAGLKTQQAQLKGVR